MTTRLSRLGPTIGVLLGVGLLISWGLSWAPVLNSAPHLVQSTVAVRGSGNTTVVCQVQRACGMELWSTNLAEPSADADAATVPSWVDRPTSAWDTFQTDGFGWPMPALARRRILNRTPGSMGFSVDPLDSYDVAQGSGQVLRLPTSPIWPGLLLDTVFWAAVVGAAWRLDRSLRSWRSRRRGRCSGCGYDRRGLEAGAACPECGVAAKV